MKHSAFASFRNHLASGGFLFQDMKELMSDATRLETLTSRPSLWSINRGSSPILGTAIHDGHQIDPHVRPYMALDSASRLREEDPFTGMLIAGLPNRVVCNISR